MSYTDRDLAIIRQNPDIVIVDDGTRTTAEVTPAARQGGKLSEYDLTRLVFEECDRRALADDRWACIYANVNGQYRKGQRPEPGLKSGVPDIFVAVPSGQFHGMYCEIKVKPNRPSHDQMEWMQRLRKCGYSCVVCYDTVASVIDAIESYLGEL